MGIYECRPTTMPLYLTFLKNYSTYIRNAYGFPIWETYSCYKYNRSAVELNDERNVVIKIFRRYFKQVLDPSLPACSPYNLAIRNLMCLLSFQASAARFTTLDLYLQSICKEKKHLQETWLVVASSIVNTHLMMCDRHEFHTLHSCLL